MIIDVHVGNIVEIVEALDAVRDTVLTIGKRARDDAAHAVGRRRRRARRTITYEAGR